MTARRDSFSRAIERLNEALMVSETDLSRDAAIQRFEFCFELAWNVIQERVRTEGLDCQSPMGCLKLAYKNGWPCSKTEIAPPTPMTKHSPRTCIAGSLHTSLCSKRWTNTSEAHALKQPFTVLDCA